jgi:hypothetical protein
MFLKILPVLFNTFATSLSVGNSNRQPRVFKCQGTFNVLLSDLSRIRYSMCGNTYQTASQMWKQMC